MDTKTCKQCGRELPVERFRKYVPRGRGIYNTVQGHHTICKDCESLSNRAAAALRTGNQEVLDALREHYSILQRRGLPPVTAAAKRVLGVDVEKKKTRGSALHSLMHSVQGESEFERFCRLVRTRGYDTADEAYEIYKTHMDELRAEGLYEEITNLVEEWLDEDM